MKIQKKHIDILKRFLNAFGFDQSDAVSHEQIKTAIQEIEQMSNEIIKNYPLVFTSRLRKGITTYKHALSALKQLLTAHSMGVISSRKYEYCKERKRSLPVYYYRIA